MLINCLSRLSSSELAHFHRFKQTGKLLRASTASLKVEILLKINVNRVIIKHISFSSDLFMHRVGCEDEVEENENAQRYMSFYSLIKRAYDEIRKNEFE